MCKFSLVRDISQCINQNVLEVMRAGYDNKIAKVLIDGFY